MDLILRQLATPLTLFSTLIWVLAFAWVATRLLGARRVLGIRVLVAGGLGYVAGVGLALAATGGDVTAPDFVWYGLGFTVVTTMAVIVMLELMQPRAPVVAVAPSLPHPIRAVGRWFTGVGRFSHITAIATRHGVASFLGLRRGRDDAERADLAVRVRAALEEAGGTFVKLGQLLSTRLDLIPPDVASEFARLRESVPAADPGAVRRLLTEELGGDPESVFADFDWQPFAAASIAQVHRCRLRTGEEVVVKVQRPDVAELVERDLRILDRLARVAESRTEWARVYGVRDLAVEFARDLRDELDFTAEARNARELAESVAHLDGIHVPRVYEELSTRRLLVMERLDGESVGAHAGSIPEPTEAAELLLRAVLEPLLEGRRFHADPHPGNVFLLADGRLGLLDFGATGRLDAFERSSVGDILLALRQRDPDLLAAALLEVAEVRGELDRHRLDRALAQFMARNLGPGVVSPSATMFNELLQLLLEFGVAVPPTTTSMFRAVITLEGTLELVSPGFPVIDFAEQVAADLIQRRLGPESLREIAEQEIVRLAPILQRAPRHLDRIAGMVERGELASRVSLFSDRRDADFVAGLVNRAVVAFSGGVLLLTGGIMLAAAPGPGGGGEPLDILGYVGLLLGFVLILRAVLGTTGTGDERHRR